MFKALLVYLTTTYMFVNISEVGFF